MSWGFALVMNPILLNSIKDIIVLLLAEKKIKLALKLLGKAPICAVDKSPLRGPNKKFRFEFQKVFKAFDIIKACLAQLVEHWSCKPRVIGSIPVAG